MSNPVVIITGANGFIGQKLTEYFLAKNYSVRALVHHFPAIKKDKVAYFLHNIEDAPSEDIFKSANILIHCAYLRYEKNPDADQLNIRGTKILIELCRKNNIKPVFLSSFSAHPEAESHYGKTKLACEKLFDLSRDLVLKPGLVLGTQGLFGEIVKNVKASKFFPLVGDGTQPMQSIAIDDLCSIIGIGLEKNSVGIYYVAEPTAIPIKDLYKTISEGLNKKIVFVPIPFSLLYFVCAIAEKMRIQLPVTSENLLGLKHLRSFETEKDLRSFGVQIKNYRESIQLLLGQNGL